MKKKNIFYNRRPQKKIIKATLSCDCIEMQKKLCLNVMSLKRVVVGPSEGQFVFVNNKKLSIMTATLHKQKKKLKLCRAHNKYFKS